MGIGGRVGNGRQAHPAATRQHAAKSRCPSRKRAGSAGFAAAWDVALGRGTGTVTLSSAKSTGLGAGYRYRAGLAQVVMYRGKYRSTYWKADDNALLQLVSQLGRAGVIDG